MRKIIRIASIAVICILGYMVATDALGRWFGLWEERYAFNLASFLLLPGLIHLAVRDSEIIKPK